ncbi:MAG: potassium channel family protein [Candidatus Dormibacteraceae bacterium]
MLRGRVAALTFETTIEWLAVTGAFATVPLTVIEWSQESPFTDLVDVLIWVVFVIEAGILWRRARRGGGGWVWVWLSVFVCVFSCPVWLFVFRQFEDLGQLVRVLRILRLVRLGGVGFIGFPAMRRVVRPGLVYIGGLTAFVIVIAAGIFTLVEPQVNHDYMNGLWLAVVTASTVGYGDMVPMTGLGRVTAVALMVAGIGLLTTLSASIAAAFVGQEERQEERKTRRRIENMEALLREREAGHDLHLQERMDRMEALLEALAKQQGGGARPDAAVELEPPRAEEPR